jgi:hypothetical protein
MGFLRSKLFRWPTLLIVSLVHLVSGVLMVIDPASRFTTPLYPLSTLEPAVGGLILILIAQLGFYAITRDTPNRKTLAALIPQQAMLVLSSTAVVYSIWISRFLDGVARGRAFLTNDHITVLCLTAVHTVVLIQMHIGHVATKNATNRAIAEANESAHEDVHPTIVEAPVTVVPPKGGNATTDL